MPDQPNESMSPAEAEHLHAFLASFLSPAAADDLVRDVAAEVGTRELSELELLRVARLKLTERVEVPADLEVAILIEDVGLSVDEVANVTGMSVTAVEGIVDAEGIELSVRSATPTVAVPEPEPLTDPLPQPASEPDLERTPEPDAEPTPDLERTAEPDVAPPVPTAGPPGPGDVSPATADEAWDADAQPFDDEVWTADEIHAADGPGVTEVGGDVVAPGRPEDTGRTRRDVDPRETAAPIEDVPAGEAPPLFDDEIPAATPRRREPRPDGRTRKMLFAVLGVLLVLVVVVALASGGDDEDAVCTPTVEVPVCVARARLTDVVDRSGAPGADRERFEIGEPVKLWFAFETLDNGVPYVVDYVWFRGDEALYTSAFQLPPGGRVNLSLARQFAEVPGEYAVQVRNGDDLLVERRFTLR